MQPLEESFKCKALVLKVVSRCNLNCSYCYMYNMGDSTYKGQPKVMSDEIVDAILHRTREHCINHGIRFFMFVFHGGEPLLAGKDFFRKFVAKANECLLPDIRPDFEMQTNGVLLTEDWCRLFSELNINLGVSLDGTKEENDKFRVFHSGKGAYDDIVKGFTIANNYPSKHKPGVMSVINIEADPEKTYEHFKELHIKSVDFLMPDSTYDQPPSLPLASLSDKVDGYYADWLIKIFDKWIIETGPKPGIRLFQNIIRMVLGENLRADNFGTQHNEVLVIETNGSIEAVDVLKICGDGFTKAGANVLTGSFDESMQTELAKLFHLSHTRLCKKCLCCPVKDICGGGYLPHRYSKYNGFNNPSVYCNDLLKLITHIQNAVLEQVPESLLTAAAIHKLTYEQALSIINEELLEMADPFYRAELENF